nr:cell division protein FtsZ homolog 1, chloroplastic [Tanacetum cinerariifolium]
MQEHAKTLTRVVMVHQTLVNVNVDVATTLLLIGSVCVIFVIAGLVNANFADIKAVMKYFGAAMLGVGVSSKNQAEQATLSP